MNDTTLEELAAARQEIDRLRSLLPPTPGPEHRMRQGRRQPRNLYLHTADDEDGTLVGQMSSAELAASVCEAFNARQGDHHSTHPRTGG